MKIRELMSSNVHTCELRDSLASAAQKLLEHDCGVLPVVDGDGQIAAVITDRDICMGALLSGGCLSQLCVADSMSKSIVTCCCEDDVAVALKRMSAHQVHRLPVVDAQGKLCGLLSLNDFAEVAADEKRPRLGRVTLDAFAAVSRHRAGVPAVAQARGQQGGKPAGAPTKVGEASA